MPFWLAALPVFRAAQPQGDLKGDLRSLSAV
jgi:hypothetical protein